MKLFEYVTTRIMIANIHDNNTARRLVLPGDLQGRSRLVDHDDDDDGDDDDNNDDDKNDDDDNDDEDDESNWGGRIKPLLKNLQ